MAMVAFPCVSLLLSLAAGYPSSMQCDFACMANYGPGTITVKDYMALRGCSSVYPQEIIETHETMKMMLMCSFRIKNDLQNQENSG